MSDSNDSAGRLRRAWDSPAAFWGAAGVVVALVVMIIVIIATRPHHKDTGGGHNPAPSASPSASSSYNPLAAQFVTLPKPTGSTAGYPTIYPHTEEGAVATVLAHSIAASETLDYDPATTVASAYLHNSPYASEKVGEIAVSAIRKQMGLPLTGVAPSGATVKVAIDGVKWRTEGADVVVSVDSQTTFTMPDGSSSVYQGASVAAAAVWIGNRWWIDGDRADVSGTEQQDYLQPGTSAFVNDGWKVIKNSDWTGGLL